jgi:hypothetical protein
MIVLPSTARALVAITAAPALRKSLRLRCDNASSCPSRLRVYSLFLAYGAEEMLANLEAVFAGKQERPEFPAALVFKIRCR